MQFKFASVFLSLVVASSLPVAAQTQDTIWRIGIFDRSSAEFADSSPQQLVTFVIGRDRPDKNWYSYAPAAFAAGHSDPSSAPRTIQFSLAAKPSSAYRLRVSLLVEHSSVPALRISINGRTGTFYLHPELDYSMGDTMAAFFPAYSHATVEFNFPGSYLHEGTNSIALQSVAITGKGVPDAGFNYDAIELDQSPILSTSPAAHVEPTIFYRQHENSYTEQIDVFVRYGERPLSGEVDLEVAGHHYACPLRTDQDFGEERFQIAVPEFPANTPVGLTLNLNGRSVHFSQTIQPQKKWTLFLVPHVHLDVGYSDYQAKIAAIQSRILDEAMDLTEKHPSFRFSTDGACKNNSALSGQSNANSFTFPRSTAICSPAFLLQRHSSVRSIPAQTSAEPTTRRSTMPISRTFRRIHGHMHRCWRQRTSNIFLPEATTIALLFCCRVG
jgi:alpha-mannosidase